MIFVNSGVDTESNFTETQFVNDLALKIKEEEPELDLEEIKDQVINVMDPKMKHTFR